MTFLLDDRTDDDDTLAESPWLPAAPTRGADAPFDHAERQALALARTDGLRSVRQPRWAAWILSRLFGVKPAMPLANPRLEALRRTAILIRIARIDAEAVNAFRAAGWTGDHLAQLTMMFGARSAL